MLVFATHWQQTGSKSHQKQQKQTPGLLTSNTKLYVMGMLVSTESNTKLYVTGMLVSTESNVGKQGKILQSRRTPKIHLAFTHREDQAVLHWDVGVHQEGAKVAQRLRPEPAQQTTNSRNLKCRFEPGYAEESAVCVEHSMHCCALEANTSTRRTLPYSYSSTRV
jgi:hypothetical protein